MMDIERKIQQTSLGLLYYDVARLSKGEDVVVIDQPRQKKLAYFLLKVA